MALSDQEKLDVIFYLGWPGKTLIEGSTDYSKIIADKMENLSAPIELRVKGLLTKIVAIDERIEGALCRMAAKKVGDIETNSDELYLLRKERMNYLRELSDLLDIPLMKQGGSNISVCV